MGSIQRSLESINESIVGMEAVAARLYKHEAQVDLEFVLHNTVHDDSEPAPHPTRGTLPRPEPVTNQADAATRAGLAISA
jgi:hypothetical protein